MNSVIAKIVCGQCLPCEEWSGGVSFTTKTFFPRNLCTFGQTSVLKEMQYSVNTTKCPNVSAIIIMKSSKKQFSRTEQTKEAVFTLYLVKSNLRHSFNKQTAQCGVYMPLQKLTTEASQGSW